jgi:hypothetical protein
MHENVGNSGFTRCEKKRKSTGEFSALFYDLIGDDRKFKEYYRMSY